MDRGDFCEEVERRDVCGSFLMAARSLQPPPRSWLTAVSAAIAMFLVLQAAWVPFKPDRETFHEIQQEAAWGPTKERKQEMWSGGLYAVGVPRPEWVRSPEYLASLRSHWIHQHALGWAQVLTKEFIDIDGWVFPLSYVSKSLLVWLQSSFLQWAKEDESELNREWIEGIAEAFQNALAGKL